MLLKQHEGALCVSEMRRQKAGLRAVALRWLDGPYRHLTGEADGCSLLGGGAHPLPPNVISGGQFGTSPMISS